MASDLKDVEIEKAQFVFSVYDWEGTGAMDAIDLGNALRALNLNPTLDLIGKMGGTQKRGEKKIKFDEFLPIYSQVKKEKEQGCYEDFLECLKLYDKNEDGTMLLAELQHSLTALGEKLDETELDNVFKDCMDPEDDDGNIPYAPFLQRLCDYTPPAY
ncbi:myosin light chain alkali isoform X2 [Anopheles aquasalis]|uniref:Myosin light chain alkali n=1 Tax=Anopheles aquasalis TaxID=42839 RepID=T1E8L7_ANOAQ|nr:myosin light chain alkali-like isoform X2 [Anopheles albimanus]XP_050085977.1 myosin light chain alkali isoform X2 [Anopheles aquasalis]